MNRYYAEKLSAARLQRCYEIAPPRVRDYLEAEVAHVLERITPHARVLELGCGYGRVVKVLLSKATQVIGIDNSYANLELALDFVGVSWPSCAFLQMDAVRLGFVDHSFDAVLCIQNGISAFKVDPLGLLKEMLRVARPGALILFSSYSDRFWAHRLEWFQRQSDAGLLGEIDHEHTGHGVIVCKDGFKATTFRPADFRSLAARAAVPAMITEVDDSSIFCEITVPPVPAERSA
jgi:ubiquinone/menaquinone biosynthesis C-methylase UbiE